MRKVLAALILIYSGVTFSVESPIKILDKCDRDVCVSKVKDNTCLNTEHTTFCLKTKMADSIFDYLYVYFENNLRKHLERQADSTGSINHQITKRWNNIILATYKTKPFDLRGFNYRIKVSPAEVEAVRIEKRFGILQLNEEYLKGEKYLACNPEAIGFDSMLDFLYNDNIEMESKKDKLIFELCRNYTEASFNVLSYSVLSFLFDQYFNNDSIRKAYIDDSKREFPFVDRGGNLHLSKEVLSKYTDEELELMLHHEAYHIFHGLNSLFWIFDQMDLVDVFSAEGNEKDLHNEWWRKSISHNMMEYSQTREILADASVMIYYSERNDNKNVDRYIQLLKTIGASSNRINASVALGNYLNEVSGSCAACPMGGVVSHLLKQTLIYNTFDRLSHEGKAVREKNGVVEFPGFSTSILNVSPSIQNLRNNIHVRDFLKNLMYGHEELLPDWLNSN